MHERLDKVPKELLENGFSRDGMTSEDEILDFAGASFRSVWALELLLALRRVRERSWSPSEMIKELRSSRVVVIEALNNLIVAGLVDDMVGELQHLYELKPTLVMKKIVTSSNSKLQILSDAFRIKE